jgi:hypothetical protein
MNKGSESRIALMTIGVLVAAAILCTQLFYTPSHSNNKKDVSTEQTQTENSDGELSFSTPPTTLPSSAHIDLNPHVFLLFEILFEEITPETVEFNLILPVSQCFRTLFGLAISPNAP